MNGFIRLEKLKKNYKEGSQVHAVLQGVDATFSKGEIVAILGKSGSGKSTLLNLISGIDRADDGRVFINGEDMTSLDEHHRTLFRRHKIGFIFQFFNLIPTLTVLENVVLPAELSGKSPLVARERAEGLLETVGLSNRLDTFPDRLSGGEQQRVAIARALVNDPLLILADEPTGNLDNETGQQVLKLLDQISRQVGKNMILVTHSLETAEFADRVFLLKNGKLQENGKA